jgi:hypothetical protein
MCNLLLQQVSEPSHDKVIILNKRCSNKWVIEHCMGSSVCSRTMNFFLCFMCRQIALAYNL